MTLSRTLLALPLCAALASPAARAQHFASDKRFEGRAALSLLWFATSDLRNSGARVATAGALPLELGVGFRPTPSTSVALTGRLGLVQYGAGVEVAWTAAGDWGHDGLVVRAAPQIIRDFVSCWAVDGPGPCDTATYFMVEAGAAHRWAFHWTGGFSIGASLTAGSQKLGLPDGASRSRFVFGVLAPRFAFDF